MGERVRAARESAELTLTQLAEAMGIANSTLSRLENGKSVNASADTLLRAAERLSVPVGYLIAGEIVTTNTAPSKPPSPPPVPVERHAETPIPASASRRR